MNDVNTVERRSIPGYEGFYTIDSNGEVYSHRRSVTNTNGVKHVRDGKKLKRKISSTAPLGEVRLCTHGISILYSVIWLLRATFPELYPPIENLEGEIWKPIKDYPDCEISNLGRVKRIAKLVRRGNIEYIEQEHLHPVTRANRSQPYISFRYGHLKQLAGLVYRTFVGEIPPRKKIGYKDGNVDNVKVSNLIPVPMRTKYESKGTVTPRPKRILIATDTSHVDDIRDIPGFDGVYRISKAGEVYSYKRTPEGVRLKPRNTNITYCTVALNSDSKIFLVTVGALLKLTFPELYLPVPNLDGEIWKNIQGHEDYSVSNFGRVKHNATLKKLNAITYTDPEYLMKSSINQLGKPRVTLLGKNGYRKNVMLSTLVYQTFIGEIPSSHYINFKDENVLNVCESNLYLSKH